VWLNPPYAAGLVDKFAEKLVAHYEAGEVTAAIVLVNNATETRWFRRLADAASAVCYPTGRVRFLEPDGTPGAPLQGQAVLYLGNDVEAFMRAFNRFGHCWRDGRHASYGQPAMPRPCVTPGGGTTMAGVSPEDDASDAVRSCPA
jgi:hypothetical protein